MREQNVDSRIVLQESYLLAYSVHERLALFDGKNITTSSIIFGSGPPVCFSQNSRAEFPSMSEND